LVLIRCGYLSIKVETDIEEVVQVTHVELEPVERRVEVCLDTLDDDLERLLLDDLCVAIIGYLGFKEAGESLHENLTHCNLS